MSIEVANAIGLSCDCYTVHEMSCRAPEYTVDDLLTWLTNDGYWIGVNNAYDANGGTKEWQVGVNRTDGDGRNEPMIEIDNHEATASTLLAALETIVIEINSGLP